MNKTLNREYKTTFILDLRQTEDSSAKVSEDIVNILSSLGAAVSDSEDLGIKGFSRSVDPNYRQGHYIEIYFTGTASIPQQLKEKFRLDKRINRIFVESNNS